MVGGIGKAKRIALGTGARFTSFFASQQNFTSAPASLAGDPNKADTLFICSVQANSLNLAIYLGCKLGDKIRLGFNLDVIGFSFGGKQTGEFLANYTAQNSLSIPTPFNILLINNNDRGMLNSDFFLRYCIDNRWSVKVAYQHLFVEYTTDSKIQTISAANDRFRIKTNMFSFGLALTLH
ncbi:MAG: hypothetical protein ACKO13_04095 [Cytophagales bacterium]